MQTVGLGLSILAEREGGSENASPHTRRLVRAMTRKSRFCNCQDFADAGAQGPRCP